MTRKTIVKQKIDNKLKRNQEVIGIPARVGKSESEIEGPIPGLVYVRIESSGQVQLAINVISPLTFDYPVIIARSRSNPKLWEIVAIRQVYGVPLSNLVKYHHGQHEYPSQDTVWVSGQQFMPFLVLPSTDNNIVLNGGIVSFPAQRYTILNQVLDLSSYQPATGAIWLLIEIKSDGTVGYVEGSVNTKEYLSIHPEEIPLPDVDAMDLWGVLLYGQDYFQAIPQSVNDFIDLRFGRNYGHTSIVSDAVYGSGWNGVSGIAPSKNAVYDKMELVNAAISDHINDSSDAHDASAISVQGGGNVDNVILYGWITWASLSITRTASDDPTYTLQIASMDMTLILEEGMPIKFYQNSIWRYGWISSTPVYSGGNTTFTILTRCDSVSTNYDVLDTATYAISNFAYGYKQTVPFGMNGNRDAWSVIITDTTLYTKTTPTASTWYNAMDTGNLPSITIPIGIWDVNYELFMYVSKAAATAVNMFVTLSTSTGTESDRIWTSIVGIGGASGTLIPQAPAARNNGVVCAAKTTMYLNIKTNTGADNLNIAGSSFTTVIRALCRYL